MEAVEHRFSLYLNSRQNGQHAEPCHRLRGAQFLANTSRMVQRTTRLRVDKAPEIRPGNHSDLPNLARNDDDHLRTVRFLQIDRSGYAADHTRQSSFDFHDLYVCGKSPHAGSHNRFPDAGGCLHSEYSQISGSRLPSSWCRDRSSGTFGCIVFAVTGTFATLFVSARWLVAHVVWSTTVTTTVFVLAYLEGDVDITTLLARGTVLFGAVTLVPIFAHLTWRTSLPRCPVFGPGSPHWDCSTVGDWKGQSAISSRAPETILHLSPSSSSIVDKFKTGE